MFEETPGFKVFDKSTVKLESFRSTEFYESRKLQKSIWYHTEKKF